MKRPVALIIRDGWGISPHGAEAAEREGNAPLLAKTPFHDYLYEHFPQSRLSASGLNVGLPEGQMGNSEVGHLNLGAGRIVYQDLTRINKSIADGSFYTNPVLLDLLTKIKDRNTQLHFWGLLSDGGVHSHQEHLYALIRAAKHAGISRILIHCFMDGRDTSPTGGIGYIQALQAKIKEIGGGRISTLIGRYYAMDRDNRWDRVQKAYDLLFSSEGNLEASPVKALEHCYAQNITDEFIPPTVCFRPGGPIIRDGDGVLFFNFRSDRAREIAEPLLNENFTGFPRSYRPFVHYVTMTEHDPSTGVPCLFKPQTMSNILGEVVSNAGLRQLRMAETEKYPHVTYFFNGGREIPYPGEDREVIPSPKVATYDLQPEMSATALTDAVLARLDTGEYDLLILNFANTDMVGHTGSLAAAIAAVEVIDYCVHRVADKIITLEGRCLVTADHGNCEFMINADGSPNTAHTTNLVQFIYIGSDAAHAHLKDGILADVAPTLLYLLGVPQPPEMTGHSLVEFDPA
jgi:2,3-bisphosphoglycerate-independent phosphoglycerate mutase